MKYPHQFIQRMLGFFARIFRMRGNGFLCMGFQYFNVGGVCFSLSFGTRLIPVLDLEALLLQGLKIPHIF